MNSFKNFSDKILPDRCEFYGSLKDECISEKDYLHAINVSRYVKSFWQSVAQNIDIQIQIYWNFRFTFKSP